MPSIFNHETNACWPIRRSFNTFFSHPLNEIGTEEVHINKVVNKTQNITPVSSNYHISSNGYYGYQPHVNNVSEECLMDVQENISENDEAIQESQGFGCVINRKRNLQEWTSENIKRSRHEEPLDKTPTLIKSSTPPVEEPVIPTLSLQTYPRCTFEGVTKSEDFHELDIINSRNLKTMEEDLNLMQCLLKQTHGCDMYNFNSYDL